MISLILLKLFTFSQILQGAPKPSHATAYMGASISDKYCITKWCYFNTDIKIIFFFYYKYK